MRVSALGGGGDGGGAEEVREIIVMMTILIMMIMIIMIIMMMSVYPGRRGRWWGSSRELQSVDNHGESHSREMWSLFNLDDAKSLRVSDLVQGVTSVCQLDNQEFFDFYPAVR